MQRQIQMDPQHNRQRGQVDASPMFLIDDGQGLAQNPIKAIQRNLSFYFPFDIFKMGITP